MPSRASLAISRPSPQSAPACRPSMQVSSRCSSSIGRTTSDLSKPGYGARCSSCTNSMRRIMHGIRPFPRIRMRKALASVLPVRRFSSWACTPAARAFPVASFCLRWSSTPIRSSKRLDAADGLVRHSDDRFGSESWHCKGTLNPELAEFGDASEARQYAGRKTEEDGRARSGRRRRNRAHNTASPYTCGAVTCCRSWIRSANKLPILRCMMPAFVAMDFRRDARSTITNPLRLCSKRRTLLRSRARR